MVSLIIIGNYVFNYWKVHKMPIFWKHQYSNPIKVLVFISNIKSYVPINYVKLQVVYICLKLTGSLQKGRCKITQK